MRYFLAFFILHFISLLCFSQVRVVVLGSSTAAGIGASEYDSSWVGRLQLAFRKNMSPGNPDTIVTNLAIAGTTTYNAMPTTYTPPPDRPLPDPEHNVTKALSFTPDVILINFPTNDIGAGYTAKEYMDNLRYLYQYINNAGPQAYVTTTQPRTQFTFEMRQELRQLVDSINNNFTMHAVNFWDDLATTDGQYNLLPQVNSGDDIHPNNLGHRLLFQRVIAKNIFIVNALLPLTLTDFNGSIQKNKVVLSWHAENQQPNSFFEIQRSRENADFKALTRENVQNNNAFTWTDNNPLNENNFYRIKIIEPDKISYSKIIKIQFTKTVTLINNLYYTPGILHASILTDIKRTFTIRITNLAGATLYSKTLVLAAPGTELSLPFNNMLNGEYLFLIESADVAGVKSFIK